MPIAVSRSTNPMAFPPANASTFARICGSAILVFIRFQSVVTSMDGFSFLSERTTGACSYTSGVSAHTARHARRSADYGRDVVRDGVRIAGLADSEGAGPRSRARHVMTTRYTPTGPGHHAPSVPAST